MASIATLAEDEGMVTATAGEKACTLTEALPEGEILPPYAQVEAKWDAEWVIMQTRPVGTTYTCKLEVPADRR